MSNVVLIARLECRLMASASLPFLLLVGLPVVIVFFLSKGQAGGPAHSVPGLAAMCGLFGAATVGLVFFRDHGWGTWGRMRSSSARSSEILLGKLLPLLALFIAQQVLLLFIGWAFLGMPWNGGLGAGSLLIVTIVAVEASFGMLLVTFCRTIEQLSAVCYLSALAMAGIGGALAPASTLPAWINALAPVSPIYWMERGFRVVVAGDRPGRDLIIAVLILAAYATCGGAIAAWHYRLETEKSIFAH